MANASKNLTRHKKEWIYRTGRQADLRVRCYHRLRTELDSWISWFRHPQLMQSVPPSPGIQELQLLLHTFWRKSKISRKTLFLGISQKFYEVKT